jgi:uncharacterized membrane protein
MQSKKNSLKETLQQVLTDSLINLLIASPLAKYYYKVELKTITELFILLTVINFCKSYVIRRHNEHTERKMQ